MGLAWANLLLQILIIVTGGVVRLTGSGLGCSTWPQCEPGQFTPVFHEAATYHAFVEFGNRLMTGVLGVVALALVIAIWRSPTTASRRPIRLLALAPLAGIAVQAIIGGITVLVDLHPAVVGFHFLLSAALVWVSAVLVARLREGDGAPRPTFVATGWAGVWLRGAPALFTALTIAVVVLGVVTTGAGPHSGDVEMGYRFAVDPVLVARAHAACVWAFGIALVATLVVVMRAQSNDGDAAARRARRTWVVLLVVTLAQGLIGYAQYFSGLPVPLVVLHMFGSGLLVAAVTFAVLSLRVRAR